MKCSHMGCNSDATCQGVSTKESIEKCISNYKSKFSIGTWYYCEKDKKIIQGYCPHLTFTVI